MIECEVMIDCPHCGRIINDTITINNPQYIDTIEASGHGGEPCPHCGGRYYVTANLVLTVEVKKSL